MRYFLFSLFLYSLPINAETLFDLDVGKKWIYSVDTAPVSEVTNTISGILEIQGVSWYELNEFGEKFWVRNSAQGQIEAENFFDRTPSKLEKAAERLVYKYPAEIGETWGDQLAFITYQGKEIANVPAGIFECHVYFINLGGGDYSKSCIANIGIIYNEFVIHQSAKETSVLISYD